MPFQIDKTFVVRAPAPGAATRAAGPSLRRPQVWIALAILVLIAVWLFSRARS